jgi:type I restriction enzyme M protein
MIPAAKYLQKFFSKLEQSKADSENSWTLDSAAVDKATFDLSVKNPNRKDEAVLREPQEILEEMRRLDEEAAEILAKIGVMLENGQEQCHV